MLELYLDDYYKVDNNGIVIAGNYTPRWEFIIKYNKDTNVSMRFISELFNNKIDIESLKVFKCLELSYVYNESIVYIITSDKYNSYSRDFFKTQALASILLKDVEYFDGLTIYNHYDIVNRTLSFSKIRIPLEDMPEILRELPTTEKVQYQTASGNNYVLERKIDTCYINKRELAMCEVEILSFLFESKTNLLKIKQIECPQGLLIATDKYLISELNEEVNYIDIFDTTLEEAILFLQPLFAEVSISRLVTIKKKIKNMLRPYKDEK